MWVLFGKKYVFNKQETYFIGIFSSLELAEQNKQNLLNQNLPNHNEYFINEVEIDKIYTYNWSNSEENNCQNHINDINKMLEKNNVQKFYDLSWSSILLN